MTPIVYCRDAGSAAYALLAIVREVQAAPAGEIVEVDKNPVLNAWDMDAIQFPRLLAELHASVDLTDEQWMALCGSPGLRRSDIEELFERADRTWQAIKAGTSEQVDG